MAGMNMSIASQERLSAPSQPPLIHVKQGLSAGGPPPATTSRAATAITAAAATGNANGIAADERWPVPGQVYTAVGSGTSWDKIPSNVFAKTCPLIIVRPVFSVATLTNT